MNFSRTLLFLILSMSMFLLGIVDGVFRLMNTSGINVNFLSQIYLLHPVILVFGFFASIIVTERVAGMKLLNTSSHFKSLVNIPVPLYWIGSLLIILNSLFNYGLIYQLSIFLFFIASLSFILFLYYLRKISHMKLPIDYMILSAFPLTIEAILLYYSLPVANIPRILLILSFPIIFILGERVELTSFTTALKYDKLYKYIFYFLIISIALLTISAIFQLKYLDGNLNLLIIFISLLILTISFLIFYYIESSLFRQLRKTNLILNLYTSKHTMQSYFWGIVGLFLMIIYVGSKYSFDLYDASIHALAIGYIGYMFLGHGPVIFPTIANRKLDASKLRLYPSIILNIAVLIRVICDIIRNFIYNPILGYLISFSGFLVLLTVV